MATYTKIRGSTQIRPGSVTDTEIAANAEIATSKLADGADFLKRDGTVALTADLNLSTNKIINLGAPEDANDAARLSDVQTASAGLVTKKPARVASVGSNIPIATTNAGDFLDGVELQIDDRVLLKDQSDEEDNGVYVVRAAGGMIRAADVDGENVKPNIYLWVSEGTVNADTAWVLITDAPITVGDTELEFVQFFGAEVTTTASNVNTAGVGVFKQKVGSALQFRGINNVDSTIGVALDAPTNEIRLNLENDAVVDAKVASNAQIIRSKLADGSANHVIVNNGDGVMVSEATLAVSRGGTNSGSALNNNRVMISSGNAIVESAALTENRALITDGSGLPVAATVTATELGRLTGVTANVQDQLNNKANIADYVVRETPSGLINGTNTVYNLANTPVVGTEQVYHNGLLLDSGAGNDYTISSGTITFAEAPLTGDKLLVTYFKTT